MKKKLIQVSILVIILNKADSLNEFFILNNNIYNYTCVIQKRSLKCVKKIFKYLNCDKIFFLSNLVSSNALRVIFIVNITE